MFDNIDRSKFAVCLALAGLLAATHGCGKDEVGKNAVTETNNSTTGTNNANNTTGSNNANNTTGSNNANNTTGSNNANNTTSSNNANNTTGTNNMTAQRSMDILLVVDNSGSMCGLQAAFRSNIRSAVAELTASDLDVRIGVTTTQMRDDYTLEPLAVPGELQATPQPVPGFDRSCHQATDSDGNLIAGDFTPIRDAISAAVACSDTADAADYDWTNAEIECGLYNRPQGCGIVGVCGGGNDACTPEDLFPDPSEYRTLPEVLEVRSYVDETGKIDFDGLTSDFRCMSFVGTRGYGVEKGLSAAVRAVSPNMTGGPTESPLDPSAPNHGLLRRDSDFGLLFLTDENDCSDDGTLSGDGVCGGDVCEFENIEGDAASALLEPSGLADDLVTNLQMSKDEPEFDRSRVFVASIHGKWQRFTGPIPSDAECGSGDYEGIDPSCTPADDGQLAFSGDRYERFLDAFADDNTYPAPGSAGDHRTGAVCEDDLGAVFLDAMDVLAR